MRTKIFLISVLWVHLGNATHPLLNLGFDFKRIISISGFQNDCFFNAIRHAGISISRQILLDRLRQNAEDERWQAALLLLTQQEIWSMDSENSNHDPEPLVEDPLGWFIGRLENGAPIPFHAYREAWEEQIPDLIDLLGEEFDFDVRIVRAGDLEDTLQIMRDFRREQDPNIRRITLRYTDGPVGHFDLVVNGTERNSFYAFFSSSQLIGRGTQGKVFDAYFEGKRCAVKESSKQNELSRNERDVLARCRHPGIIRYVESFEDYLGNFFTTITELVSGQDLHTVLSRSYRLLREERILTIFAQLVLATSYFHRLGGIHRDIKASNVLLADYDCAKLCDFGLSKIDSRVNHLGGCLRSCGTPHYLAPELIRNAPYGQAVDIWALGILLFELSEGQPPFTGNSTQELYRWVLAQASPLLSPDRSPALRNLIAMLLNKNPAERPTAQQILNMDLIRLTLIRMIRNCTADLGRAIRDQLRGSRTE